MFLTGVSDDGGLIYVTVESETYSVLEHMLNVARGRVR